MLSLLKYFLMAMGALFLGILIGLWYVWETNLWNVRTIAPLVLPGDNGTISTTVPVLLQEPEGWVEQLEADTRECFVELFGDERVLAIEAGASLTGSELMVGAECLR